MLEDLFNQRLPLEVVVYCRANMPADVPIPLPNVLLVDEANMEIVGTGRRTAAGLPFHAD